MARIDELRTIDDVRREMPNRYRKIMGRVPEGAAYSLGTWVFFGKNIGGGFVNAILENDLVEAYSRADSSNTRIMEVYARWLHNDAPGGSWRKENFESWAEQGGLIGIWKEQGYEEISDTGWDSPGGGS
jgi:hypothetical protein